jgi:hypothetical protein
MNQWDSITTEAIKIKYSVFLEEIFLTGSYDVGGQVNFPLEIYVPLLPEAGRNSITFMGATWKCVFYVFLINSSWHVEYLHIQKKMLLFNILS